MSAAVRRTETDVACTACGCVCDDITLQIEDDLITQVGPNCPLAAAWFEPFRHPMTAGHEIQGQPAELDEALASAAEILAQSHAPLIYGLSRSSSPGQRAAVALAEQIGATIDTTASVCHGPSIMAIQMVGESTCTLGEIRERADLILFWGANPVVSHPRHFERYSVDPVSELLPRGRADRHVIVLNDHSNETAQAAHQFVPVPEGQDFELITQLRALTHNPHAEIHPLGELTVDAIRKLAGQLTSCRYGVVFFGLGLAQSRLGHLVVAELLRLVADLNARTRFVARRLRIPGDVAGADSVLCWQTGFPFAVNLGRRHPRYNPGEFSAEGLLERGEVDCCLLIGSESLKDFSPQARRQLAAIPLISLDYPHVRSIVPAQVRMTTAVYGVHRSGTAYRMDEVPLPLRALCHSPLPSDETVLQALQHRLAGTVPRPRFS